MYESHESLQKYFQVSCEELDQLVELARSVDGVFGSRMTGGGFGEYFYYFFLLILFIFLGGCTVTLVNKSAIKKCIETIQNGYKGKANFYQFEPCDGARSIDLKKSKNDK
jgi:galactokinase